MDRDTKQALQAGCCCCTLIASITMFACSFATLTPHEIGLHYNGVTFHIEEKTYDNGRYFLGLGHGFHVFPRRLQYIEFSESQDGGSRNRPISVWSKDGQSVIIEAGFYYRIIPGNLTNLYFLYKDNYLDKIEDIAMNVLRDVSTQHDTIDFFVQRDAINKAMHESLNARLLDEAYVEVPRFNLLRLDMPDRFEKAVELKVIAQQEKNILEFKQLSEVINRNILVVEAEAQSKITVIRATSQANATKIRERSLAQAFKSLTGNFTTFRKQLADKLGFNYTAAAPATTNYDNLMQYVYLDVLKGSGESASNTRAMLNVDSLLLSS